MAAALVSFPSRRWKPWGLLGRGLRAGTCGENKLPGKIGSGRKFPGRCLKTETSLAFLRNKKAGKGGWVVVGKGERWGPETREDHWG